MERLAILRAAACGQPCGGRSSQFGHEFSHHQTLHGRARGGLASASGSIGRTRKLARHDERRGRRRNIARFAEYPLALNPQRTCVPGLHAHSFDLWTVTLYLKCRRARAALLHTVKTSTDLQAWSALGVNQGIGSVGVPNTATISLIGEPHRFHHLEIDQRASKKSSNVGTQPSMAVRLAGFQPAVPRACRLEARRPHRLGSLCSVPAPTF